MFKRSRTQRSYVNGDDEISVVKVQESEFSRPTRADTIASSRSSCSSDVDPSHYDVQESCVIRNFPKHKSSHLRFLAWVAYTRKYTDDSITEDERRTCPLLWCRSQFKDQESMLEHVYNCPYLSKGLYWCFHCQKPERVGNFKCRRCQGAPSRTDRISSVAKKIFSKLGARPHRFDHNDFFKNSNELSKFDQDHFEESSCSKGQSNFDGEWDYQPAQELPNDEIVREMPADFSAASHELADTYISEMVGTECPVELGVGEETWADNFYIDEWESSAPKIQVESPKPPRLSVDTSCSPLSLQSSYMKPALAYNASNWDDAPLSTAIISPMSAAGGFDYLGFEISPTDSERSGNTFSTVDSGYASATSYTAPSAWDFPMTSLNAFPSMADKKGKKRDIEQISQDWVSDTILPAPQATPVVSITQDTSVSRSNSSSTTHSASRCPVSERPQPVSPDWQSSSDLAASFSTILDLHITHSKTILLGLPPSPTIQELLAISKSSLISLGLDVLQGVIEGRNPTAVIQVWAFMHVAFALAIAVDKDEAKVESDHWWRDCVGWVRKLPSERQREVYLGVARAVWQPVHSSVLDKENELVSVDQTFLLEGCKHFLDIFEYLHNTNNDPPHSDLDSFHQKAKSHVIDALIQSLGIEAFIEDVITVERRLMQGQITTIRALELELAFAGKLASQSETTYYRFITHVTTLCDRFYEDDANPTSRTCHYIKDIAELKNLLPEENYTDNCDYGVHDTNEQERDLFDEDLFLNFDLVGPGDERGNDGMGQELDEILSQASTSQFHGSFRNLETRGDSQQRSRPGNLPISQSSRLAIPQPNFAKRTASLTPPVLHESSPVKPDPILAKPAPDSTPDPSTPQPALSCNLCGFTPSGAPRWFASNLRRHKRTQHPSIPEKKKVYQCRVKGCKSVFTRSDNLRCHGRERHGVDWGRGGGVVVGNQEENREEGKES